MRINFPTGGGFVEIGRDHEVKVDCGDGIIFYFVSMDEALKVLGDTIKKVDSEKSIDILVKWAANNDILNSNIILRRISQLRLFYGNVDENCLLATTPIFEDIAAALARPDTPIKILNRLADNKTISPKIQEKLLNTKHYSVLWGLARNKSITLEVQKKIIEIDGLKIDGAYLDNSCFKPAVLSSLAGNPIIGEEIQKQLALFDSSLVHDCLALNKSLVKSALRILVKNGDSVSLKLLKENHKYCKICAENKNA